MEEFFNSSIVTSVTVSSHPNAPEQCHPRMSPEGMCSFPMRRGKFQSLETCLKKKKKWGKRGQESWAKPAPKSWWECVLNPYGNYKNAKTLLGLPGTTNMEFLPRHRKTLSFFLQVSYRAGFQFWTHGVPAIWTKLLRAIQSRCWWIGGQQVGRKEERSYWKWKLSFHGTSVTFWSIFKTEVKGL